MVQTLALLARAPQMTPVANLEQQAQQAHANDQQSALMDYRIKDAPAAMAYEQKQRDFGIQKMGNESDQMQMQKDAGYPGLQRQLADVFGGMSPEDYKATQQKVVEMRKGFNYVTSFDPKTPEGKQAFDATLEDLHKRGVIDDRTAREAHRTGPTPLALENMHRQLNALEDAMSGVGARVTPLQQSTIDLNKSKSSYFDARAVNPPGAGKAANPIDTQAKVQNLIFNYGTKVLGLGTGSVLRGSQQAEAEAKLAAYAKKIHDYYKTDENGLPLAAAPGAAPGAAPAKGSGVPKNISGIPTPETAEDIQTLVESGELQDGDPYINPATGEAQQFDQEAYDAWIADQGGGAADTPPG